jgi:hypothetical protein
VECVTLWSGVIAPDLAVHADRFAPLIDFPSALHLGWSKWLGTRVRGCPRVRCSHRFLSIFQALGQVAGDGLLSEPVHQTVTLQ